MSTLELTWGGAMPAFLDDDARTLAKDSQPAAAKIMALEISLANQLAHAGHPLYSWCVGGTSQYVMPSGATEITSCYRQVYMAANKGATSEAGEIMAVTHAVEPVVAYQTGQGIDVSIGASTFHSYWNTSTTAAGIDYPESFIVLPFSGTYGYSTVPAEVIIGGVTSNWLTPLAGSIWQDPDNSVDAAKASTVGSDDVHLKGDIIGTRDTGVQQLTSLVNVVRDTWFHQRPQAGWSTMLPGNVDPDTSAIRGVHFTTSSQSYRYIFDQTYGDGGTAITSTSPALTLPLANAGGGVRTQVRVYPFVYAAMSGGTDTGALAIANKNSAGSMNSPTTLVNVSGTPLTISGTTFRWYPTLATWNATTAAYFMGYTGSAYDRVALCAKSLGATDHVIVGAFTLLIAPATS